jgi:hypothetical protein
MTLVNYLHSGDPDVIQNTRKHSDYPGVKNLQVPDQGVNDLHSSDFRYGCVRPLSVYKCALHTLRQRIRIVRCVRCPNSSLPACSAGGRRFEPWTRTCLSRMEMTLVSIFIISL